MEENYAVMYRKEQVGKLQMQKQGLYCRLQCRCQLPGDDIYRLRMLAGEDSTHIGVLVPEGDGFVLDKKIPAKRIPSGQLNFVVRGNRDEESREPEKREESPKEIPEKPFEKTLEQIQESEVEEKEFVPISEEEPFPALEQVRNSVLAWQDEQPGIFIQKDNGTE